MKSLTKARPVTEQTFKADTPEEGNPDSNAFTAIRKAEAYLKENGYITGSMCYDEPIGFAPADMYGSISKWYNLSPADRKLLTGTLVSKDFRNGDIHLVLNTNNKGNEESK